MYASGSGSTPACVAPDCSLVALAAVEAFAQATEGSLRGYIRDEQGAPMPGVTITAKSTAATRPLVTDPATTPARTAC